MTMVKCRGSETLECFLYNCTLQDSSRCIHFTDHVHLKGMCNPNLICNVITKKNSEKCVCKEVNKNEV